MIHRLISSANDDQLANLIGQRAAYAAQRLDEKIHTLHHSERLLLGGTFEELRKYFDEELPHLRRYIQILSENRDDELIIDVGYSMTMLYAAYYAVINSPRVTVNLHTPPAFGGETRYAKTHPHVIQKLVYNVLLKAKSVVIPTEDSLQALLDVYPRLQSAVLPLFGNEDAANMPDMYVTEAWGQVLADLSNDGFNRFKVRALPLPDEFMPIYNYVRDGIAIFANFERGGGVDDAIQAWMKLINLYPQHFKDRSVSVCGVGDHEQAGAISVAFPAWKVVLNPPISKLVEIAGQAEVVVMPDEPPHAGPTKELFAAIGAGAGIVAHEASAAGDYAGPGVVHFSAEGERPLMLANALLRALQPEKTGALMAATKERRDALRNVNPVLYRPADLDSLVEAG